MAKLFNKKRIEDCFNQIERNFKNEIDNFSDRNLTTLDIEQTTEQLFNRYRIIVPTLEKEKTSTSITTEEISGYQFPSGTMFEPGRMYNIEIANYKIPFKGDYEVFECLPTTFSYRAIEAELATNSLIIQLTNWGEISGNDKVIEDLKNMFLQDVKYIEDNLNVLKSDIDKFEPVLKTKIRTYIENKVKHAKLKFDSNDKLNPFK